VINDAMVAAVRRVTPHHLTVEDNKIILNVENPAEENPDLVRVIVAAGGDIQFVTEFNPQLEDAYLKVAKKTP
jgi:hypothetical protein